MSEKCSPHIHQGCDKPAVAWYEWPFKGQCFVCQTHLGWAKVMFNALGMDHIQVYAIGQGSLIDTAKCPECGKDYEKVFINIGTKEVPKYGGVYNCMEHGVFHKEGKKGKPEIIDTSKLPAHDKPVEVEKQEEPKSDEEKVYDRAIKLGCEERTIRLLLELSFADATKQLDNLEKSIQFGTKQV